MSRYTITIVEHESKTERVGGYNGTDRVVTTDIDRYSQTVDRLDIEAVIEAVNLRLELPRDDTPEATQ